MTDLLAILKHESTTMRRGILVSVLLVAAALGAYWPVRQAQFTNFDDPGYVTNNPDVFHGLTWHGVVWAFTTIHRSNWHPLTWLSHMADCSIFGDSAGGPHLVNVGFHLANTLLLFLLFWRMTGAVWRSGFAAALFALHPLHVESVAWISERKDVLSTFFGLLTLLAYVSYVRESKVQSPKPKACYGLGLGCFVLGLMSKPMLVTLPFVMLLLDYWPLQRFQLKTQDLRLKTLGPLLREKLPFFALSAVSSAVTYWAQNSGGATVTIGRMPLMGRLANASVAYVTYLAKTFWPAKLAVFYPIRVVRFGPEPLLCLVVLAGLTVLAVATARRAPYVLAGWLWFLGTLVPVIGLIQVGAQAMADRYTYLPLVGIFFALVWGVTDLALARRYSRWGLGAIGAALLMGCLVCTRTQVRYWQSSETLFRHALAVTHRNFPAHLNLGLALVGTGDLAEAGAQFDAALRLKPDSALAHYHRGVVADLEGNLEAAEAEYELALKWRPDYEEAHSNLGNVLALQKKYDRARAQFLEALRLKPGDAMAHLRLAQLLVIQGQGAEAAAHCSASLKIRPDSAEAYYCLGDALMLQHKPDEAEANYLLALRCQPDFAAAHTKLGTLLLLQGDRTHGMEHLYEAVRIRPDYAEGQYALANELARQQGFAEAVIHLRAAIKSQPNFPPALNDLAWILATQDDPAIRNVPEAIRLAQRACELTGNKAPSLLATLGVAQSEAGQFPEAIRTTERAVALAAAAGDEQTAAGLRRRLEFYRKGQAYSSIPR